ncbi:uncharacterized protein LOC119326348 [Triticum dicoccoides]|uniref:uncharacterized protein LOC119326348 n=1 Tax=Triticum dicoccoides TaxID=85692 RepID=UPI00189110EC|nr:uncharacterized protein LOC119326348 [Triticum dicoccoides]
MTMASKKGSSVVLPCVFLGIALLLVVAEARGCAFCKDMPGISSRGSAVLRMDNGVTEGQEASEGVALQAVPAEGPKKTTLMASCYQQCIAYIHYLYIFESCMSQCYPTAGIVGVLGDAKKMGKTKQQQQQEEATGGGFGVLAMLTEHAGRE